MSDWREQAKAALEEALGHGYSSLDNFLNALVDAVEPIIRADERAKFCDCPAAFTRYKATHEAEIRERIAQEIEAQPIDSRGSQAPRGPVTFARREAQLRSARIARGGDR